MATQCTAECDDESSRCCNEAIAGRNHCVVHDETCRRIYGSYKSVESEIKRQLSINAETFDAIRRGRFTEEQIKLLSYPFTIRLRDLLRRAAELRSQHQRMCFTGECADVGHKKIVTNYFDAIQRLQHHIDETNRTRMIDRIPVTSVHGIMGTASTRSAARSSKTTRRKSKGKQTSPPRKSAARPTESLDRILRDFKQPSPEKKKSSTAATSGVDRLKSLLAWPSTDELKKASTEAEDVSGEQKGTIILLKSLPLTSFNLEWYASIFGDLLPILYHHRELSYTLRLMTSLLAEQLVGIPLFTLEDLIAVNLAAVTSSTKVALTSELKLIPEKVVTELKEVIAEFSTHLPGIDIGLITSLVVADYATKIKMLQTRPIN